jgi:hypothetical protein
VKAPRDEYDKHFLFTTRSGNCAIEVESDKVTISAGTAGLKIARNAFNRLIDVYINTPAIRAALKAKDAEIERLENVLLDIRNRVKDEYEYGPTGAAITRSEHRRKP